MIQLVCTRPLKTVIPTTVVLSILLVSICSAIVGYDHHLLHDRVRPAYCHLVLSHSLLSRLSFHKRGTVQRQSQKSKPKRKSNDNKRSIVRAPLHIALRCMCRQRQRYFPKHSFHVPSDLRSNDQNFKWFLCRTHNIWNECFALVCSCVVSMTFYLFCACLFRQFLRIA